MAASIWQVAEHPILGFITLMLWLMCAVVIIGAMAVMSVGYGLYYAGRYSYCKWFGKRLT